MVNGFGEVEGEKVGEEHGKWLGMLGGMRSMPELIRRMKEEE